METPSAASLSSSAARLETFLRGMETEVLPGGEPGVVDLETFLRGMETPRPYQTEALKKILETFLRGMETVVSWDAA